MANFRRVQALLEMADEDLAGARTLLDTSRRLARYHVQQSAEKAVKALLEQRGLNPGREHRFEPMAELLPEHDKWRSRIKALDDLSPAATTRRYPTAEGRIVPPPSREHLESEIAIVAQLLQDIRKAVTTAASPVPACQSPALERKSALAKEIVAIALARKLEVPDNIEEKLVVYVDEPTLREMVKAVKIAASFQDALHASSIIMPKYDRGSG